MHRIETIGDVLAITLRGRTTVDDYEAIVPTFASEIEERASLRILWDIRELDELEPREIWEDVEFNVFQRTAGERIAIVGRTTWRQWATRVFRAPSSACVRFFGADERRSAVNWLRG